MKVHYINILLFALPLNILINTHKNPSITPCHIPTTRLLYECELYAPANYDNDPQMKELKENFNKQTQQRFEKYDERMKTTHQKCKEQCDKEIQKIILNDKLEKQMEQQLTTLETKINTDDIPTCICEKSIVEKVEKGCLRCGEILGAAMPELGSIGGTVVYATAVKSSLELGTLIGSTRIKKFITSTNYGNKTSIIQFLQNIYNNSCASGVKSKKLFCYVIPNRGGVRELVERGTNIAEEAHSIGVYHESQKFAEMTSVSAIFPDPVVISAIVVVTIALILLIIYLILRYRRKKKMKKKLQYIKLLNQ
ncbi:rifin PIR protein, putative [Plasmodium reichenowi]|uniref:Rifin PIR protein, putative n=1 Tax=Plasmodium reichenowi TaxID=5854 RepID=A0A2P9D4X9_PLARE|nr:rifin PIR protein, putative [Plasmodium reichenowi]